MTLFDRAAASMELHRPVRVRLSRGDLLVFQHMPKTAGTTVFSLMSERFAPEAIISVDDENPEKFLRDLPESDLRRCRLMRAHYGYLVYRYLPRKPVFLTMLRDPVQRTVSLYEHIRRIEHHPLHKEITSKGMGLKEFVESPDYWREVEDGQVRRLVGWRERGHAGLTRTDILMIARYRLAEVAFFGIYERLEESLDLLAYTLGWEPWGEVPVLNPSDRSDAAWAVAEDVRQSIEEHNRLDRELYSLALVIFQGRHERMVKESVTVAARLGWAAFGATLMGFPQDGSLQATAGPPLWLARNVIAPLGKLRRWVIPVDSHREAAYLRWRRRLLGW